MYIFKYGSIFLLIINACECQLYNGLIKRQLNYWSRIIDRLKERNDKIFDTNKRRYATERTITRSESQQRDSPPAHVTGHKEGKVQLVTGSPLDRGDIVLTPNQLRTNSTLLPITSRTTVLKVEPRRQFQEGGATGATFNLNANSNANADPVITNQFNPSQVLRVFDNTLGNSLGVIPYFIPIVSAGMHHFDISALSDQRRRQCTACKTHLTRSSAGHLLQIRDKGFGTALQSNLINNARSRSTSGGFGTALAKQLKKSTEKTIRFSPIPFRPLNPFVQNLASHPYFSFQNGVKNDRYRQGTSLHSPLTRFQNTNTISPVEKNTLPSDMLTDIESQKVFKGFPKQRFKKTKSTPHPFNGEIVRIDPIHLLDPSEIGNTELESDTSPQLTQIDFQQRDKTAIFSSTPAVAEGDFTEANSVRTTFESGSKFPDYSNIYPFGGNNPDQKHKIGPFISGSGLIDTSRGSSQRPRGTFGSGRQPDTFPPFSSALSRRS